MVISLVFLASGCIAFGLFPGEILRHVAEPSASVLLHPTAYARAVLASGGTVPASVVTFAYFSWTEFVVVAGTCLAAVPVAVAGLRHWDWRGVQLITRVQSGSVNDYAAYLVVGLLISVAVLAGGAH